MAKNSQNKKNGDEWSKLNDDQLEFLYHITHELKNPVSRIMSTIDLLKNNFENYSQEEMFYFLDIINDNASTLHAMISDILNIDNIKSDRLQLSFKDFNLTDEIQKTIKTFLNTAEVKKIEIIPMFDNEKKMVYADRKAVSQILNNLLSNALKFSPSNKKVRLEIKNDDDFTYFSVIDQGPGLTETDKKNLFKRFTKLSAKPTGDESSTGLGLSIAKNLIIKMNGEIWCESDSGKGAKFTFSLPKSKD